MGRFGVPGVGPVALRCRPGGRLRRAPPGVVPYIDAGSPAAAAAPIPYTGYQSAGWPDGAVSWPQISPFESPPVTQHQYQNGLWFREQVFGGRKYYAMLSGTFNRFAPPNDNKVGNPNAPQNFLFSTTTGVNGGGNNGTVANSGIPVFIAHDWGKIPEELTGCGFMGQVGFWNPDDSGVMLTGFWAGQGSAA